MGLTAEQFWDLTPRHFAGVYKHYIDSERRQDSRFALLACLYANSHRDEKKRNTPFELSDFMPGGNPVPSHHGVDDMVAMAKAVTMIFTEENRTRRKLPRRSRVDLIAAGIIDESSPYADEPVAQ